MDEAKEPAGTVGKERLQLSQEEAFARIRLLRSPNVGPVSYRQLLGRFGTAIAALEALPDIAGKGGRRYTTAPVKRIDAEEKTKGGIIIPDSAKEKPSQGEILSVGPGGRDEAGKLIPIDLNVGDIVLFGKWSGTEVKIDGQEVLIMKESDIMGVITDGSAKKKAA